MRNSGCEVHLAYFQPEKKGFCFNEKCLDYISKDFSLPKVVVKVSC